MYNLVIPHKQYPRFVNQCSMEVFHEYLRSSTEVIDNNFYQDSDNIFESLNNLQNNTNIIILSANKETLTEQITKK